MLRVTLSLLLIMACAPAMPTWSGGSATPKRRTDVAAGGAVRVPVGGLRRVTPDESRYRQHAEAGGVVPAAMARYGLAGGDVGLLVAGTGARLEYRREFGAHEGVTRPTWLLGVALTGGAVAGEGARGARFGFDVPLVYGIDFGGLYEVWIGPRVGLEHVRGRFDLDGADVAGRGTIVRAGGTFGLAVGFRRVHAFLELSVLYEHAFVAHGARDLDRGGLVLLPSFGVRVRI